MRRRRERPRRNRSPSRSSGRRHQRRSCRRLCRPVVARAAGRANVPVVYWPSPSGPLPMPAPSKVSGWLKPGASLEVKTTLLGVQVHLVAALRACTDVGTENNGARCRGRQRLTGRVTLFPIKSRRRRRSRDGMPAAKSALISRQRAGAGIGLVGGRAGQHTDLTLPLVGVAQAAGLARMSRY